MKETLLQHAKVLWDFTRLNQTVIKSEVMIVIGNDDPRSADHAADLYHEGWAPLIVISGKEGTGTRGKLPADKTEADFFCDIMTSRGVPKEAIILEKGATNTGKNIRFSQRLLRSLGHQPKSVLIVTKKPNGASGGPDLSKAVGKLTSRSPVRLLPSPEPSRIPEPQCRHPG